MVRITFINGSHYCEPGKSKLKLKRDFFDKKSNLRRLQAGVIVTFLKIFEDDQGKWINVRTENNQFYNVKLEDLIFPKDINRRFK